MAALTRSRRYFASRLTSRPPSTSDGNPQWSFCSNSAATRWDGSSPRISQHGTVVRMVWAQLLGPTHRARQHAEKFSGRLQRACTFMKGRVTMSADLGSRGRRFKSCQPDQST